tara:strand:+ start:177 stop:818 length:642 start_codon:yes stop_codon:yes gene_type:complete
MYHSHSQVGRTRVNKVREGIKNKKTHNQYKVINKNHFDQLFLLQKRLFKEGMDLNEYSEYLTEKIDLRKYYYRNLTSDMVDSLKKNYGNMIERENNRYNEIGDLKKLNRSRRKKFRGKKRILVRERKRDLIDDLFQKMSKSGNSIGILKNTEVLVNNPDNWHKIKKCLFTGGRYIESYDKKWTGVYKILTSPVSHYLFNFPSHEGLNQYVVEN